MQKIDPPSPHVRKMSAMTKPPPPPCPCGHKNALIRHWHTQSFNTKFARFNYILSFNTKFNYIISLITKFNYILSFNTKFTQSKRSARWRKTYSHVICFVCASRPQITWLYVLCVVHTGPENRKRNKTICDFPSRKKLKYGRPHSRNPPPPLSANVRKSITPPLPPWVRTSFMNSP